MPQSKYIRLYKYSARVTNYKSSESRVIYLQSKVLLGREDAELNFSQTPI